jgi:hypothetical protein
MTGNKLMPEKITSPFQLMAAWFVMLVSLVSVLLTAAAQISKPDWAAGYLVIFTSVVILLVILCVILMLTKFRPHLQEGKEYAEWLKDKNAYSTGLVIKQKPLLLDQPRELTKTTLEHKIPVLAKDLKISVIDIAGADDVIKALKQAGFNAEKYVVRDIDRKESLNDLNQSQGIWVGARIPSAVAIKAIKVATKVWPHLQYMHLSSDGGAEPTDYVHDQLFFGGSTSAVRRYNLDAWSNAEIQQLGENMSLQEFHSKIRAKYP